MKYVRQFLSLALSSFVVGALIIGGAGCGGKKEATPVKPVPQAEGASNAPAEPGQASPNQSMQQRLSDIQKKHARERKE